MINEKTLIKNCKKGKPEAQEQLYEMFSPSIMHVAKRYTNSSEEAEDVFQESFISIFLSIKKVKAIHSLKNWVYTIAVRTAIQHLQKSKKLIFQKLECQPNADAFTEDDFNIFDKMEYDEVMTFIRGLPDGYRTIFNMYLIEGYSHKEIAELLNISETTSRSQLTRCKRIVKEHLEELRIVKYEKAI